MKTLTLVKQTAIYSFIGSTVLFAPLASQALTVEEVTNPRQDNGGWVTDMADVLSDRTETELNNLITNLEQTNGTEIAVVTVPETTPAESPKAFATELFNYWGIGKAEEDNGVLFLVSTGDKRVEIETGYGIESILPDAQVGNIIDTKVTPQYKKGNFDRGTLDGTKAIITALDSSTLSKSALNESKSGNWSIFLILIGIGLTSVAQAINWLQKRQGKVFVNPQANTTSLKRSDNREIHCAKCRQPMERVQDIELSKAQKAAQKLGSVSFRGYKCPSCSNINSQSIIAFISNSSRYRICPHCDELTVTRTETTLKKATRHSKGKVLISDRCYCCDYSQEKTINTPRLRPPSNRGGGSGGNRSSDYYLGGIASNYSNDSSYGGSSGGDFGGGSSGGGGAGGSW